MMTKSLQCLSTEVRNLPHYDGLNDVNIFLEEFEREVLEVHQFQALEMALRTMFACWWGMHKERFIDCNEYK